MLAPPIRVRRPLRSAADLFRSRWFAVGWIVAIFAWGLHVGALALAPLSIVQAVLSGGLVFLALLAVRFFGFSFHEPIGSGALEITGRFLAFCLVIAGAALMPAPMRATPEAG